MRDYRRWDSNLVLHSRIGRLPVPDPLPRDREGLRRAIAEVTAAAARVGAVEPIDDSELVLLPRSEAQREKDRILCEAWERLAQDQQAALRAALGLSRRRSLPVDGTEGFRTRCRFATGCFLWLVGLGVLSCLAIAHPTHPLTPCIAVAAMVWLFWRRAFPGGPFEQWLHAREEDADLQVALALDDPGHYLDALDAMARAEFAGWEALRGEARMPLDFTRRRNRLCERLGFAQPVISG